MTVLNDYQFEILPDTGASSGVVFGLGAPVSLDEDGFDPGETDVQSQDQTNSRRGVRAFGRDVQGAKTWAWSSHTDMADVDGALSVLEDFSAAWMPDAAREPGWVTAIRYRLAGRYRRVYGRPRRYAAPPTNLIINGMVPITHDFACVDSYTYDDVESSVHVPYSSASVGGGWTFPAVFPISTATAAGSGDSQLTIGGNARTYPIIRFNGPWTNPVLETANWTLSWKGTIRDGGYVEIDTRPWKLTVLDQDGASQVGALDRQTWLEDCYFDAKTSPQVFLSGSGASGGASADVRWRNAWTSI